MYGISASVELLTLRPEPWMILNHVSRRYREAEVFTEVGVSPDNSIVGKMKRFFKRSSGDPFYAVVAHRNFKPVYEDQA